LKRKNATGSAARARHVVAITSGRLIRSGYGRKPINKRKSADL